MWMTGRMKKMSGKRTGRRMERTGKHRGASDGGPVPIPLNGYKIHNSWCVCLCTLWLQYDLILSAPDGNIQLQKNEGRKHYENKFLPERKEDHTEGSQGAGR